MMKERGSQYNKGCRYGVIINACFWIGVNFQPVHIFRTDCALSPLDVLAILCLSVAVLAVPLPGRLSADPEFLENNLEFSRKVSVRALELRDMMCSDHGLCEEGELRLVKMQLGLQAHPVDQCQPITFSQDGCFSQLVSGLRDFYSLVRSLPVQTSSEPLALLGMDLRDLLSNFKEEMDTRGIMDLNSPSPALPPYPSTFHIQAGTYLIMSDLHRFMESIQTILASQ